MNSQGPSVCSSEDVDEPLLGGSDATVSLLAGKDKISRYNKPNLRFLYLLMVPTCLVVEITNGYDSSMISGLQAVPSWIEYYHHPHSASLGLMASMYSLGAIAASPFAPSVVDNFGRRNSMLLGCVLSSIGGTLQGSALNFVMFNIARLILGFSVPFSVVAAFCLIGELSHPKDRALLGGLFTTAFYTGAIAAAGITLWTFSMSSDWGWRIPSLLQAAPSLFQIAFIWLIPESPRWLISKGRGDEALAILVKYHAEGDENSEFAQAEYAQIEQMLEAGKKITRMDRRVFLSPGMRKRVLITIFLGLCAEFNGFGLISHFLVPILDNIGIHDNGTKNIINFAQGAWRFTNSALISFVVPRYPRRTMYLAGGISISVILVAFTVASAEYSSTQSQASALVVLALLFLHNSAFNLGFGLLNYTFLTELYPFHLRASGVVLYSWCLRCAIFFTDFINPIGLDVAGWKWYIAYCIWNAFAVVFIYQVFPETSGRTLEELTFLYGEDDLTASRDAGVERLHESGATESYGTVDHHPRTTVQAGHE